MSRITNILSNKTERGSLIVLVIFVVLALIAFLVDSQNLASATDIKNIYKAPFEHPDYILGTDGLGRSVLYGLLNGAKITLLIALLSSLFSLLIGLCIGFLAAYYGNDKLKLNILSIIGLALISFMCFFYVIYSSYKFLFFGLWIFLILALFLLNGKGSKIKARISIPLDTFILKVLEIQKTLPGIFIILLFLSLMSTRSIWNVILLITIIRIPIIIRLARSEILKVKSQEFILAAEGMGISTSKLFISHIIPNIMTPIQTYLVYGIASTVLVESLLSFLGLGLPLEVVTWGSMLSSSRQFFSAWWLAIFPGLAIFILIFALRKYFSRESEDQEYYYI